jgi:sugar phosphate isomerase/epimerase
VTAPGGLGSRLVLGNVSVASFPLREVVVAASAAGFHGISVLGRARRRALREGASDRELQAMIRDHGLELTEVEAAGDWLSPPPSGRPVWMQEVYGWIEYLGIAEALGATTLVATHFGAPAPLARMGESFAHLCDRAADHGLRVALEFPAWATIGDVATAWDVVREADRPNGGVLVDLWHHDRSGRDDDALRRVPGDRILSVQVCDAAASAVGPLIDDVTRRQLPGEGHLDAVEFLRTLDAMAVAAPVTVEVYDAALVAQGVEIATRRLHDALRRVVETALPVAPATSSPS